MEERRSGGITQLLLEWRAGDQGALEELLPIVYDELRRLAHRYMRRERSEHLLQTTALVHESYLRLASLKLNWRDRNHFFAVASRLMRRVLADSARRRNAGKRGGGEAHEVPFDEAADVTAQPSRYLVALDDALKDLESIDSRKCRLVELRYFGGLSVDEAAEALELSPSTVDRELRMAKAWLHSEITGRPATGTARGPAPGGRPSSSATAPSETLRDLGAR